MQKWTTSNCSKGSTEVLTASTSANKVSLAKILSVRSTLNEIECWALLGQTAHALQDVLLKANGLTPLKKINDNCPVIYPGRLFATITGKIVIDQSQFEANSHFIHPLLSKNMLYRDSYSEHELETLGIYSLGKTIQACQCLDAGSALTDLLIRMTSPSDKLSLLAVLECVSHHWKLLVGTSPISRFVSQLCKLTLGWTMTIPSAHEISHIEFSKLNESSSSSGSASPTLPTSRTKLPRSSSPILNNNNNVAKPPKLPPKTQGLKRKIPQRNPSRLYRIVKPLAEISINPGPATNRCVGPEFFVMQDNHAKVLDLATNFSRKDFVSKQVDVVMLNGQKYFIHVNAANVTSGEILDAVLRDQDIKESNLFTLALRKTSEYWPLSNESKLSKVAPLGWKDPKQVPNKILGETLTLYQRIKYIPDDIDNSFKDPCNKHQFYLQLRKDVLQGQYLLTPSEYLSLAGMALQVEFGDFSHDIHDDIYFDLEHYLPLHMIKDDVQSLRSSLVKLHKAHLGQSQSKTEMKFCKELARHDNYGFHFFQVFQDKKLQKVKLLGIHLQGIFLFDLSSKNEVAHQVQASFFWHKITRIQYDTGKFQLLVQDEADKAKNHKLKFYAEESKSKVMFDLASAHHQHSNQLRLNAKLQNEVQYRQPPRPMRTLKSRLMPRRQTSQHKLYTTREELQSQKRASLRRSTTVAPASTSSGSSSSRNDANYLVKRLAHYSSMADALVGTTNKLQQQQPKTNTKDSDLNVSDKENKTPDRNYRYKVYLEPEEDINPQPRTDRVPLQERPHLAEISTPKTRLMSTNPNNRRKSEGHKITTSLQKKGRRISHGIVTNSAVSNLAEPSSVLRMGTRISLSALHRERLRLTTETCPQVQQRLFTTPQVKTQIKHSLDLDYDTMEYKSILPNKASAAIAIIEDEAIPYADPSNESLSESLMERFDNMETDEALPERQIVPVTVVKDAYGKIGLKVTGLASGIYVEEFDVKTVLRPGQMFKKGDRIVAINGTSLENVKYENALEMIRKSQNTVQFLVSQIKD